jgi:hypothetical protein
MLEVMVRSNFVVSLICAVMTVVLGSEKELVALETGGNNTINIIFEAKSLDEYTKPGPDADMATRESYIRAKYVERKFYDGGAYSEAKNEEEVEPTMEVRSPLSSPVRDIEKVQSKSRVQQAGSVKEEEVEPTMEERCPISSPVRDIEKVQSKSRVQQQGSVPILNSEIERLSISSSPKPETKSRRKVVRKRSRKGDSKVSPMRNRSKSLSQLLKQNGLTESVDSPSNENVRGGALHPEPTKTLDTADFSANDLFRSFMDKQVKKSSSPDWSVNDLHRSFRVQQLTKSLSKEEPLIDENANNNGTSWSSFFGSSPSKPPAMKRMSEVSNASTSTSINVNGSFREFRNSSSKRSSEIPPVVQGESPLPWHFWLSM